MSGQTCTEMAHPLPQRVTSVSLAGNATSVVPHARHSSEADVVHAVWSDQSC
jgi:hypothetical protein